MVAPLWHNHIPIITLLTDFGQDDGYAGAMQGVILSICPTAALVTISHNIPPHDIRAAAFVLYQAFSYYPAYTIHCAVVDPSVGSHRRAVAVHTSHGLFVGPDNGVFSLVLAAGHIEVIKAVTLTNPAYQLPRVSNTFHGRDIFAPAAAHLANGVPLEQLGPRAINLVHFASGPDHQAARPSGQSRVIHIDHFGNLILDITAHDIDNPEQITFIIGDKVIRSLSQTFTGVDEGQLLAYVGSSRDHIEIAVRNGSAARVLGVRVGDIIKVEQ